MRNPWMSFWLSAANSWAGAVRGLWAAELQRQQTAIANEMIRQTIDFWTRTAMAPIAGHNEASRLRAGSDQRKLCSDGPFARDDHAVSRPMAAHRRMSVRWRHNQHRPGEQAGGALAAAIPVSGSLRG